MKECTTTESFKPGETITFNGQDFIVKEVSLSKLGDKLNNDHKYGYSKEGVVPQGDVKDILFRVRILLEEKIS